MKKGLLVVLASVALSGLTAYAVVKTTSSNQQEQIVYSPDGEMVKTVNLSLGDYPDFTYAAETAVNAVVYVEVSVKYRQQYQSIDPFQFFFGDGFGGGPQAREREQKGSGSGVIIRQDGYIVTNNHVVENATTVKVTLNNNKTYDATVIGTDPATDVALIKIDASGLPTVNFADSDKVRLGEWVLAIGSPLGRELQSTITAGIVSAKGRQMPSERSAGELKIESFIQTDAAVNPGNSGGALVNKEGELIGINTAIVSTTGSFSGYSFAVPSNIVKKVVSDLIDFGSVKRAQLGISMINLEVLANDEKAREQLGVKKEDLNLSSLDGVYVAEVSKGGAADKAGIKKGDFIVAIDGTTVKNGAAVQEKVNGFHPGDKASVQIIRDGKEIAIPVTFQDYSPAATGEVDEDGAVAFYGAKLKAADKDKLAALGLKSGVEIVSAGNGKMAQAGAEDGIIIRYVNDQAVSKPQDVIDIAKKSKRAVYIEGVTASGRPAYFAFGKE